MEDLTYFINLAFSAREEMSAIHTIAFGAIAAIVLV